MALPARASTFLVLLVLLAAGLVTVPGATAAALRVNEPLPMEGTIEVPRTEAELQESFFLLAGALVVAGRTSGPIVALGTEDDTRFVAGRISVWDMEDPRALAEDRPAHRVEVGTLDPDVGASFFWGVEDVRVAGADAFSLSLFFDLLGSLPDMGPADPRGDGPYPPALVSSMAEDPWTFETASENRSFYLPLGTGFTVTGGNGTPEHFTGARWMVTMRGAQEADLRARAVAVPLAGTMALEYAPGTEEAFDRGFTTEKMAAFIDTLAAFGEGFEGQGPQEPPQEEGTFRDRPAARVTEEADLVARQPSGEGGDAGGNISGDGPPPQTLFGGLDLERIKDMGDLANGVVLGQVGGNFTVAGAQVTEPGPSLIRFTELSFGSFTPETARFEGHGSMVFTQGTVVAGEDAPTIGFLGLPALAWALYLIALGAWIGSRFWSWRDKDEALSNTLRPWALGALLVGTLVSFLLFDREIAFILGTSLIDQIGHNMASAGGATGVAVTASAGTLGLVALIQFAFWGIAMGLIGFPIRVIGRSALKVSGFTKATYGFASAVGAFFAWLLGARYILPYLGEIAGQVIGSL